LGALPQAPRTRPRILYISGEPHTPGHAYRVERPMAAAASLGWDASWSEVAPVNPDLIRGSSIVVLWRVPHSTHVQGIIDCARAMGARVVFDIDDLMFRRDFADVRLIDGIRSQRFSESETKEFFEKIGRTMACVDLVTCPTEELASQVRFVGKPAFVLPNGFDDNTWSAARLAVRTWGGWHASWPSARIAGWCCSATGKAARAWCSPRNSTPCYRSQHRSNGATWSIWPRFPPNSRASTSIWRRLSPTTSFAPPRAS
jgi:hypothetical protein